jgi:hypothetical protein
MPYRRPRYTGGRRNWALRPIAWREGTGMVRMDKESAERLLKGKTPREIYELVREKVEKSPNAKFQDLFETLDWVVQQGYATAEELEAVEEEGSN